MRAAEAASGVPLAELMERAGAALAGAVVRFAQGAPVLVLCGPGNNGGDGYVAARLLSARGVDVRIAACADPGTDLSRAARSRWTGPVEPLAHARAAPVLVDCLFGTGPTRALSGDLHGTLHRLGGEARLTIAADLPSGVGTDDGSDLGAVGADLTLAFGAAKPAHLLQPAAHACGRVLVADLSIDVASAMHVLDRPRLAAPGPRDHKYTRGMVAVVAGSMAGAASLGASAAARIAGYTLLTGKGPAPLSVARRGFEAIICDARLSALLIGPGLDDTPANHARLAEMLASNVPLVLDAGALALLASGFAQRAGPTIVTPHEGEFARLFPRASGDKATRAASAAQASGAVVVLKGADTVVAAPDGRVALAPPASGWLASAGTGDVLAGIVAGLLGRGGDPFDSACAGVWLHGEAARLAGPGLIADDLPAQLPAALAACL